MFAPVGLGADPEEVHEVFRRLLVEREHFEVDSVAEGRLAFHAETVRRVVVWSAA